MIKAHKLILIASSQYFHNLLKVIPASTPFICLDGVSSSDLKFLVEYIYHGEIKVPNYFIKRFLLLAKKFLIKGLSKENEIQNIYQFKMEANFNEEIEDKNQILVEDNNQIVVEDNNEIDVEDIDEIDVEYNDEIDVEYNNEIDVEYNDEIVVEDNDQIVVED